jgi:hypothetical protein
MLATPAPGKSQIGPASSKLFPDIRLVACQPGGYLPWPLSDFNAA